MFLLLSGILSYQKLELAFHCPGNSLGTEDDFKVYANCIYLNEQRNKLSCGVCETWLGSELTLSETLCKQPSPQGSQKAPSHCVYSSVGGVNLMWVLGFGELASWNSGFVWVCSIVANQSSEEKCLKMYREHLENIFKI